MDVIILFARVLLGFARLNNDALITFCQNVITMMTSNASYPTPSPALAAVESALDLLRTALQEAITGDRVKISARKDARRALLLLMRQLAAYVQGHCNEEVTTLLSSGFLASRRPSPSIMPAVPGNPRLSAGPNSGTVSLRHNGSDNTANFTVQTATGPSGPFSDYALNTGQRTLIEGLAPASTIYVRVRANGTAGSSDWSTTVSRIVL